MGFTGLRATQEATAASTKRAAKERAAVLTFNVPRKTPESNVTPKVILGCSSSQFQVSC